MLLKSKDETEILYCEIDFYNKRKSFDVVVYHKQKTFKQTILIEKLLREKT